MSQNHYYMLNLSSTHFTSCMNVVVQCRCGGGTSAVSTEAQIVFGVVARVGPASTERQQAAAVSSGGQHQQPRPVAVVWSCVHPVCCLY